MDYKKLKYFQSCPRSFHKAKFLYIANFPVLLLGIIFDPSRVK